MTVIQANEIERLSREVQDLRDRPILKQFANDLCSAIGTILATMPIDQWPQIARLAFDHARQRAPNAAALYLERLPR